MTQTWKPDPQFKLEVSGETYTNDTAFSIQLTRPENNISFMSLRVDDYKSAKYVDVFDAFDSVDLSLRYGSDSWTKVFSGVVTTASPKLSVKGEVLEVGAWGLGISLLKTHCDESYGKESIDNSTRVTPKQIIDDIISEHVNKIFGVAAGANWSITSKVDNAHSGLNVTFLNSQYLNNFVNINRVCDLTNAYAQGLATPQASVHWYVDPSGNFYFKKIDVDHSDGSWDRYWGGTAGTDPGTQASSTITVKEDMIVHNFRKNVEEYANHIVLSSKWRMPSEDYWTEDNGGQALWGSTNMNRTNSTTKIVGSHSLLLEPTVSAGTVEAWYPSAKNAGWDLTKCGSEHTIPNLSFWMRRNQDLGGTATPMLRLYTDATNYFTMYTSLNSFIRANDEWSFLEIPVGPFFYMQQVEVKKGWVPTNSPSWANINWIDLSFRAETTDDFYIDDLHFSGMVVREAKDSSEISANKTYMKVIRNDTAVNDTLVASEDSGTAARLAYAELLRRSQTPIASMIRVPLAPTLLPGQTVFVKACQKSDGSYRINQKFRVKELKHVIDAAGFRTVLNLTSDVTNTHAFAVPSAYSLLKQYAGALAHSEARDLKGGAVDNLIPRLSKSY